MSVRNVVFKGTLEEINKGIATFNKGVAGFVGGFLPFNSVKNNAINITFIICLFTLLYNEMNFCMKMGSVQGKANEEEDNNNGLFILLILLSYMISIHISIIIYKFRTRFVGDQQSGGGLTNMMRGHSNLGILGGIVEYFTISGSAIESIIIFFICLVSLIICFILYDGDFETGLKKSFKITGAKISIYALLHIYPTVTTISGVLSKYGKYSKLAKFA